jgi:hypothetical protein
MPAAAAKTTTAANAARSEQPSSSTALQLKTATSTVTSYFEALHKKDLIAAALYLDNDIVLAFNGDANLNVLSGVYPASTGWLSYFSSVDRYFKQDDMAFNVLSVSSTQAVVLQSSNITHKVTGKMLTNFTSVVLLTLSQNATKILEHQIVPDSLEYAQLECAGTLTCSSASSAWTKKPTGSPAAHQVGPGQQKSLEIAMDFLLLAAGCILSEGGDCTKADAACSADFSYLWHGSPDYVPQGGVSANMTSFTKEYFKYTDGSIASETVFGAALDGLVVVYQVTTGFSKLSLKPLPAPCHGASHPPLMVQATLLRINALGKLYALESYGNSAAFAVNACSGQLFCQAK